jgi:hypothetical protein
VLEVELVVFVAVELEDWVVVAWTLGEMPVVVAGFQLTYEAVLF